MIKRDGYYILTIDDWNTIIKYFMLSPNKVIVKEAPDLTFTEYQIRDIYTKKVLLSFYDHDGKIRIPGTGKLIAYEIDTSQILTKNPSMPPQNILDAVKRNTYSRKSFVERISDKISKHNEE